MHDPIKSAREDLALQNFSSVISVVSNAFEPQNEVRLTVLQKERLLLLRADAYSMQRNHTRALSDAVEAIRLSNSRSPQAHFVAAREHLLLLNIRDSNDFFDIAESLMQSPPPRDALPESDELAMAGYDPQTTDPAVLQNVEHDSKVVVTYEWAADLQQWRRYEDEARAMALMLASHVIPARSLRSAISLMMRRVNQSASHGIVVTFLNNTGATLQFEFDYFFGGEYFDGFRFPATIGPGDAAVACAHASSWTSSANGVVVYSLGGRRIAVMLSFESPVMGSFKCGVRMAPTASLEHQIRVSPSRILSGRARTTVLADGDGERYCAFAGVPNVVQSFVVAKVVPSPLSDLEIYGVLEFLHVADLKRVTVASRRMRHLVNRMPPVCFFGTIRRAYPDYCLPMDFERSPWTVMDQKPVLWKLRYEGTLIDRDELSVVDEHGERIFCIFSDLQSRAADSTWFYGARKCPCGHLEESRMPLWKTLYAKAPGGRQFAVLAPQRSSVTLQHASSDVMPLLTLSRDTDASRELRITKVVSRTCVAKVRLGAVAGSPMSRSKIVAEIELRKGADAFLVCLLAFAARYKWDPSPPP